MNKQFQKNYMIDKFYKKKYNDKQNIVGNNRHIFNKNMVIHKICGLVKDRYYYTFRSQNVEPKYDYSELFGCNEQEFGIHLEKLFKENMSFENHGEWELDHIFPVSKCDINDTDSIHKCFHYTNMQPLWKIENRLKSNKIILE